MTPPPIDRSGSRGVALEPPFAREPGEDELPPAPGSLAARAVRLTVEDLRADPPRREYLLRTASGSGVFPRGRVGLLAARGGSGKTLALIQIATAIATGTGPWGPAGWHATEGRVLLLLGEEDLAEIQRRLHFAAKAARLDSDESLAAIADRVTMLPLAGVGVALTADLEDPTGALPETDRAAELRALLCSAVAERRPYSLVILDPLARFAGAETEKDNSAATRLIQTVETFTAPNCGAPAVIVAHHVRKRGREDDQESSDPIRGASALVDGARWAATLDPLPRLDGAPELVRLRVVKSNYAPTPEPLVLCRPADGHGCLRVATAEEVAAHEAAAPRPRGRRSAAPLADRVEEAKPQILDLLRERGEPLSASQIRAVIRGRKEITLDGLHELEAEGLVRRASRAGRWILAPHGSPSSGNQPEPGTAFPGDLVPGSRPPFRGRNPEPGTSPGDILPEGSAGVGTGGGAPCGR